MRKILLLLLCISLPITANENHQVLIPASSPLYEYMDYLFLETASSHIIQSKPISVAEFKLLLSTIDQSKLGKIGQRLWNTIDTELSYHSFPVENLNYRIGLDLALETYFHSINIAPWQYGYNERAPFANLHHTVGIFNSSIFYVGTDLRKDFSTVDLENNFLNIPFSFDELSFLLPQRTYMTTGGPNWRLSVSRDKNDWGNGQYSNFIISDEAPFHDSLQLHFYDNQNKMSFMIMSLTHPDFKTETLDPAQNNNTPTKTLFAHRAEMFLFDFLRFSMNESLLVFNMPLDVSLLNPSNLFHQLFLSENATSFVQFETNIRFLENFDFYYQIGFNQIQTPYEKDNYTGGSDTYPSGMGHLTGVKAVFPQSDSYFYCGYEFSISDTWMYLNTYGSRQLNYNWSGFLFSNQSRIVHFRTLGHKAGNDSIVHFLYLGFENPLHWKFGTELIWHFDGIRNIDDNLQFGPPHVFDKPGSGTSENILEIKFLGQYQLTKDINIYGQTSMVYVQNLNHLITNNHLDFQTVIGIEMKVR